MGTIATLAINIIGNIQGLEQAVSAHLGAMGLLWVAVDDDASRDSMRAHVERLRAFHRGGQLIGDTVQV